MLLKSRKKDDVISVKLNTGEEIFGRFVKEDDNFLSLRKAMKLIMSNGNPGFTSVLQTSDQEELAFNKAHIIVTADTLHQIKKEYLEATSGIVTPDQSSTIIHP